MTHKEFDVDGKPWDKPHCIAPVVQLLEQSGEYAPGWYHCDEVEQLHGPFNSLDEAAKAFEKYCEEML